MARPSKLTPEIQELIGDNIALGMPYKYAAEAAGITESTFYDWMSKGENTKSGKYSEFSEYIKSREAEGMNENLRIIRDSAKSGAWSASAWLLERRYPDEFGRRERVDMKAEHSGQVQINLTVADCGEDV